jgi:hypothetical protein
VAYWVKIQYQRKEYVVNFDCVNTFCHEKNGRVTFWLPNCAMPIIIHPQNNFEDYQKILSYLEKIQNLELENANWVKIDYDRNEYIINMNSISSFCHETNGRITIWLPDVANPLIINPTSNPESYEKIVHYLQQVTGYSLSPEH